MVPIQLAAATLDGLADYIDRELQAKSRITAALAYPMVVVVLAIGTVAIRVRRSARNVPQ